jgi:hypothetical protein
MKGGEVSVCFTVTTNKLSVVAEIECDLAECLEENEGRACTF